MPRVPLLFGSYEARSPIANAQRSVNLFPETNQGDAPVGVTQYPRPGLTLKIQGVPGPVRAIYRATTGATFFVRGSVVWFINFGFAAVPVGTIDSSGPNPCSMSDNGSIMVLVDSTGKGYWLLLGSTTLNRIVDSAFYGATRVQFLDGFFIFNHIATNQFYVSPPYWNGTDPFDPLYIASKTGGPDQILSIAVRHRELWLIGQVTSEVWYNTGGADFPFERLPGVFVQYGTAARYSVAESDVSVFFLGRNNDGQDIVCQGKDYNALRISTYAVEEAIQSYSLVSDAIGYCYQQEGHTFYVLNFPTADKTWAYDLSTQMWSEWTWTDNDGVEHRHRAQCASLGYDHTVICGDHENGNIYAFDLTNGTDNGDPIMRRRGFPHIIEDGKRVSHISFQLDVETGQFGGSPDPEPIMLRWFDREIQRWSDPVPLNFGTTGEYAQSLMVQQLGMTRDRVYEVFWSFPGQTALQGAWIETERSET